MSESNSFKSFHSCAEKWFSILLHHCVKKSSKSWNFSEFLSIVRVFLLIGRSICVRADDLLFVPTNTSARYLLVSVGWFGTGNPVPGLCPENHLGQIFCIGVVTGLHGPSCQVLRNYTMDSSPSQIDLRLLWVFSNVKVVIISVLGSFEVHLLVWIPPLFLSSPADWRFSFAVNLFSSAPIIFL